jgi:hypothetical protein
LPSVRKKTLGKEPFADEIFAECSLPSVTLGKGFAECKIAFAECLRHSAKNAIPVVGGGDFIRSFFGTAPPPKNGLEFNSLLLDPHPNMTKTVTVLFRLSLFI